MRKLLRAGLPAVALAVASSTMALGETLVDGTAPADLLKRAEASIADRQSNLDQSAEQNLVKFLALNRRNLGSPSNREALALLCRIYSGQSRYGDIIGLLDRNADIVSAGDTRTFDFWRAKALFKTGDTSSAIALINPGLRLASATNDTVNLRLVRLAADIYGNSDGDDDLANAEKALDFYLKHAATTDPALAVDDAELLKARLMARRGATNEAFTALSSLADRESTSPQVKASAMLDLVSFSETNAPAALAYANRLASMPLGNAATEYLVNCGRLLASRRETAAEGARMLKKAIRGNQHPSLAQETQIAIADAWLSIGSNTIAAAEFNSYLEMFGTSSELAAKATAGRAEALYRLGEFSEAATLFKNAAEKASDTLVRSILDMRAADALHAEGKYEAAAAIYGDIPLRAHAGMDSKTGLRLLREYYPDSAVGEPLGFLGDRASFMEADSLERCGKTEEALKRFDALAAAPDAEGSPFAEEALYRSAMLLERRDDGIGSGSAAIKKYTSLISSATNNPALKCRALLGRGRCHYRNKTLEIAIADFAAAENGGGGSAEEAALYHIYALYGLGRDDEALSRALDFEKTRGSSNLLPSVLLWTAQYHYNKRDYARANELFLDFASRWPDDGRAPDAMLWAAKTSLKQSENQSAAETLASLGQRYASAPIMPEARYLQAQALCNLARFEDAVLVINDAIAKFPSSPFSARALILKGDAIFSLYGSAKAGYGVANALAAYEAAAARSDITPELSLECDLKRARCFEKSGDAARAYGVYHTKVIQPYYEIASSGNASPQCVTLYERAVFAAAAIAEQKGDAEAALGLLRRLAQSGTPGREQAQGEIDRIEQGRR